MIAQVPNQRQKMSDMTGKEKAVGMRTRTNVKADVVAPKKKKWRELCILGTLYCIYGVFIYDFY
jgi:hypothetical protein